MTQTNTSDTCEPRCMSGKALVGGWWLSPSRPNGRRGGWYWNINEGGRWFTTAAWRTKAGHRTVRVYLLGRVWMWSR